MAAFPSTLPDPLLAGYSLSPVDPSVRTDMEVGGQRVRRRTKARNDKIDLSWCFTDAEMLTFRNWYEDETTGISGGSSWFDIKLNIGLGGSTDEEARFSGIWKAQRDSQYWKVTATLEIR